MIKKRVCCLSALLSCLVLFSWSGCQNKNQLPSWQKELTSCEQENKFALLFLADGDDADGTMKREILEEVSREFPDKVRIVEANHDGDRGEVIDQYKLQKAQETPSLLVIAPNGAITRMFGKKMEKKSVVSSLVSDEEADLILSLQKGQTVFLCLYEDKSDELKRVKGILGSVEAYFKGKVTTQYVDINDTQEASFVKRFPSVKSVAVFPVVPPGRIAAQLEGSNINQQTILKTLVSACGPGCGSSCKP